MINMNKIYIILIAILFGFNGHSQYCQSAGPTSLDDSNVQSVNLTGDVGIISFTGCPGELGIQDLTNQSTTLTAGNSYSIDIQFGTCGGNFAGVGEVWIDFNGDQTFDVNESIGNWSGTPPTVISTFNFTVPLDITNNSTVMRVTQHESGTLPLNPCESFTWGSTMDFTINLTGGIDCSGYIGNNIDEPIIVASLPYSETNNNSICYTNNNFAYASPDVYYLITPNDSVQSVNVSLCGSSFDTYLSVFDINGNSVTFNDDAECGAQSEVDFSTVNLDSIIIVVQGWGNEKGTYNININKSAVLGIDDSHIQNIEIFPNPVSEYFTISGLTNTESEINIYDISGKIVLSVSNYNGAEIDISKLEKSIYFVQVNNSNLIKLIVN